MHARRLKNTSQNFDGKLNQECRDNTAKNDSPSDCENLFIGTINVQNSNPSDSGDINLENTNNRNSSTERLSHNLSNRFLMIIQRSLTKETFKFKTKEIMTICRTLKTSITFNISRDIYIDVTDKKNNSDWNVSLQTNNCVKRIKLTQEHKLV